MLVILDKLIIIPIIGAFAYGLVQQIRETIALNKSNKKNSKLVIWNNICSLAYGAFFIAFTLNALISFMELNTNLITSENTSIVCSISLAVFFISKYGVVYKK